MTGCQGRVGRLPSAADPPGPVPRAASAGGGVGGSRGQAGGWRMHRTCAPQAAPARRSLQCGRRPTCFTLARA
eukprot:3918088-Lingulodinium_polyedra.AAC.1